MHTLKLGIYSSYISAAAIVAYTVVQIMQIIGVLRAPLDEILIYSFSLCIAPPFLLAILSLLYVVPVQKRIWAHAALLFSVLYNMFIMLMYIVQLTIVIPFKLKNEILLVKPHSLFWVIDAIGYINMGIAALLASFVFNNEIWTRGWFLAHGLITVFVAIVYFSPQFSVHLLMLASPWSVTAFASMLSLSIYFRKSFLQGNNSPA